MTLPAISIRPRDISLLTALFESRVMTAEHIATLHFNGSKEAAKKRLQKLKAAGLLGGRPRKVFDPAVLFLTRKAFVLLSERGILQEYPSLSLAALEKRAQVSELTLRHELEVMDVKAAFHSAIKPVDPFRLAKFTTWPRLYQFEAFRPGYNGAEVIVRPDGYICIHENEADGGLSEHAFFLELDRSTELQETLVARAGSYVDYYKSGGYAERRGGKRDEFRNYPFRVLIVLQNAERRNNTAERILQSAAPIFSQVMLTTLMEVIANPLGAIWMRPKDYRDATKGTPFDPERRQPNGYYCTEPAREAFVEANVRKRRLLEE